MSYQKLQLIGNVGNIDVHQTEKGQVVNFSLATHHRYNGERITTWHPITVFGKRANVVADHVKKGHALWVEAVLRYGSYEKQVGNETVNIPTTSLVMTDFGWIAGTGRSSSDNVSNMSDAPRQNQQSAPAQQAANGHQSAPPTPNMATGTGGDFSFDDDIPFDFKGRGSLAFAL